MRDLFTILSYAAVPLHALRRERRKIEQLYKNYESVSEKSNLKTGMENLAHNAEDDSEDKGEARDWNN